VWAGVACAVLVAGCAAPPPGRTGLERIEHVVAIYAENRSFDNLYGHFPGANGLDNATAAQATQVDRDGSPLVPTIVVSPYARRGYVDHTPYDTTSIIKFITRRFALEPLPGVRPGAGDLTNAFDFGS